PAQLHPRHPAGPARAVPRSPTCRHASQPVGAPHREDSTGVAWRPGGPAHDAAAQLRPARHLSPPGDPVRRRGQGPGPGARDLLVITGPAHPPFFSAASSAATPALATSASCSPVAPPQPTAPITCPSTSTGTPPSSVVSLPPPASAACSSDR